MHPISSRQHGSRFNAAAIPLPLAEEVAAYVTAKFYMDRIRYTKEAEVTDEEIKAGTVDVAVAPMSKKSKRRRRR